MSHNLYDKYAAVGSSGCMNAVNGIGRHIHCTVKTECHICAPEIIVNGLRQGNYVEALFAEKIGRLLASVAAKHNKTFQL